MRSIESALSAQTTKPSLRRSKLITSLVRTIAIITFVGLMTAAAGLPSCARRQAVLLAAPEPLMEPGACSCRQREATGLAVRTGVRILGGACWRKSKLWDHGRVAPSGAVRATISAAGQTGGAFGHLWRAAGRGHWRTPVGRIRRGLDHSAARVVGKGLKAAGRHHERSCRSPPTAAGANAAARAEPY